MKTSADPRGYPWLRSLVSGIAKTIRPQCRGRDGEEFSAFLAVVLADTFSVLDGATPGRYGGVDLALGDLCLSLGIARKTAKRYLAEAARAGLLKGVLSYDGEAKRRRPLEIIVNPILRDAYGKTRLPDAGTLGKLFGELWLTRRDCPGDVQGFDDTETIPWGRFRSLDGRNIETAPSVVAGSFPEGLAPLPSGTPGPIAQQLAAAATGGKKVAEAVKREQNKEQRIREGFFVQGCAELWQIMQARAGMGQEPPAWSAQKISDMPDEQRRQRATLVKVFRLYGGQKAAVAWQKFCGAQPERDQKGRLVFNPARAFAQYSSPDKKPSDFGKHINLILSEAHGRQWFTDQDNLQKLRELYGESFDAGPASVIATTHQPQQEQRHGHQEAASTPSRRDHGVAEREDVFAQA